MSSRTRSLAVCLGGYVLLMGGAVLALGLSRPYPGDEVRFIQTARQFAEQPSPGLLRHYEEMSTPLPFAAYGVWGSMVGWDLAPMRMGALLIGLAAAVALHAFLFDRLGSLRAVAPLFGLVVINPYWVTLSLFVYTDMPAIFFALLALIAAGRQRPVLLALALAGALLCRQYLIFLNLAMGAFYLLRSLQQRQRGDVAMLAAVVAGGLPLAALVIYWGGLTPINQMRHLYLPDAFGYSLPTLLLYLAQGSIYLLPLVVWLAPRLYRDKRIIALAVVLSLAYGLWPIEPSPSAIEAGYATVGLFHRAVRLVTGGGLVEHLIFYTALLAAMPLWLLLSRDLLGRLRRGVLDDQLLLELVAAAFLAVMPLSYLRWEKYFLPLLPVMAVLLWRQGVERAQPAGRGG